MATMVDPRNVVRGNDGQVYITLANGAQIFLAECESFKASLSFTNMDFQTMGSQQVQALNMSFTVSVELTEIVIRDDVMLRPIFDYLKTGNIPYFDICGKANRRSDNKHNRQVYRNCIPDGSLDLLSLQPGEIIKRAWQFRCNATPELQEYFPGLNI